MRARRTLKDQRWASSAALGFIMLVTACAGMDPGPARREISLAESSIARAQADDAAVHAASPLRLAEEKLAQAAEALDIGNHTAAQRLAEQADIDARVAAALAQTARTQEMAAGLRRNISELRRKIEPNESAPSRGG